MRNTLHKVDKEKKNDIDFFSLFADLLSQLCNARTEN